MKSDYVTAVCEGLASENNTYIFGGVGNTLKKKRNLAGREPDSVFTCHLTMSHELRQ
jgi:hypothetical protein